jgi:apolipoprotein N-acyltransferase
MHYHSIWNWYLHLHPPQRVGLGIIVVVAGLALAAFAIVVLSLWFYELIRGHKQGWVPLLVGVILAVILMAAGVPLIYCIVSAYTIMFCVFLFWDM